MYKSDCLFLCVKWQDVNAIDPERNQNCLISSICTKLERSVNAWQIDTKIEFYEEIDEMRMEMDLHLRNLPIFLLLLCGCRYYYFGADAAGSCVLIYASPPSSEQLTAQHRHNHTHSTLAL